MKPSHITYKAQIQLAARQGGLHKDRETPSGCGCRPSPQRQSNYACNRPHRQRCCRIEHVRQRHRAGVHCIRVRLRRHKLQCGRIANIRVPTGKMLTHNRGECLCARAKGFPAAMLRRERSQVVFYSDPMRITSLGWKNSSTSAKPAHRVCRPYPFRKWFQDPR